MLKSLSPAPYQIKTELTVASTDQEKSFELDKAQSFDQNEKVPLCVIHTVYFSSVTTLQVSIEVERGRVLARKKSVLNEFYA